MWSVAVVPLVLLLVDPSSQKCQDDSTCLQAKTHGMWSADCYDKNFRSFPQCLRSDVEVIELSTNRLRQLTRENLSRYSNLKILYLGDNMLSRLENSTFQDMHELVSLDLTLNGITKLPPIVFHLPSLKRLYLSQNHNINIVEVVDETRPITSPLEALHIGWSELETLPNLGVVPTLLFYNVSGNNLESLELKSVAGLCSLQIFDNSNFTASFESPCDCWNIQRWLRERGVKFTRILCDVREQECPYTISTEDMDTYNECKKRVEELKMKSLATKIGIGVGVALILLLLIGGYFYYRRRKQKRCEKSQLMNGSPYIAKKENEGLL